MPHANPDDDALRTLLTSARTIAVVGASNNAARAAHGVTAKLLAAGYRVLPVNPQEAEIQGQKAYASLSEAPKPIDVVVVFRRPEHTPAIADEAVQAGARALWLQVGVVNEDAARRAREGGLVVVMDACIGVTHARLGIPRSTA